LPLIGSLTITRERRPKPAKKPPISQKVYLHPESAIRFVEMLTKAIAIDWPTEIIAKADVRRLRGK